MPLSNRALSAATALLLAGCTTVGPNFERPDAPTAAGYAMAGDAVSAQMRLAPEARAPGDWWTALGSAKLDAVIRQALVASPTIAEAEAAIARAQAQASGQRAAGGYDLTGIGGVQRERVNTAAFGFTGFPSPTITLYSIGAAVTYDLDLFGRNRRAVEAADADLEAEQRRADAAYLTLSGRIALQAVKIAELREQLAAVEALVAEDHKLNEMIRAAEAAGSAPRTDVVTGDARLAQDEAAAAPLRRDLAAARHQLAILSGKSPSEWTAPDFDLAEFNIGVEIPVALPSSLVRNRPDILAAEADLHAATARIGVARAAEFPDLRLSASLTQGALAPENLFKYSSTGYSFGPSITGLTFRNGALKAQREAAEAEAREALARYQATVLRALGQVADVMASLAEDDQHLAALSRAEAAAQAGVRSSTRAYELGGGPLIAVVDAQRTLIQAQRTMIEARARRYTDVVELYAATAGAPVKMAASG